MIIKCWACEHPEQVRCRHHPRDERLAVSFEHRVSHNVGEHELRALDKAIEGMLLVLEHGARDKQYDGTFVEQGYEVQIEHAEQHLKRRGNPDPQSGLDELMHTLVRLALAYSLTQREAAE